MKPRNLSPLVLAAGLGLVLSSTGHAQFVTTNLYESETFGTPVGGTGTTVANNGVVNAITTVSTGTSSNPPAQFTIAEIPQIGTQTTALFTGTLTTMLITFTDPVSSTNYFTSIPMTINYDFGHSGSIDLVQNYILSLTPFIAGGFTGVDYTIVPINNTGTVTINNLTYVYASAVANSSGALFDGSSTTAALQFQFLAVAVPEPSTYALAGVLALGAIVLVRSRSSSASKSALAV